MTRRSQKAGSNSEQLQVSGDLTVNVGLTAAEGMKVAELVAKETAAAFTVEALKIAMTRIEILDAKLIAVLDQREALAALADPAFQMLLKKAQRSAASSEREADYERLAQMLGQRAQEADRRQRAAADQAIQVVDLVDDDALVGMTVARLVQLKIVWPGLVDRGLESFERFVASLLEYPLPRDREWVEHLDSLGLVRISQTETFHPAARLLSEMFNGYVCTGINDDDQANRDRAAAEIQAAVSEHGSIYYKFVPHELKPGFLRVPLSTIYAIDQLETNAHVWFRDIDAFRATVVANTGLGTVAHELVPVLMSRVQESAVLRDLCDWWDSHPVAFRLTQAGTFLAAANTKRLNDASGLGAS